MCSSCATRCRASAANSSACRSFARTTLTRRRYRRPAVKPARRAALRTFELARVPRVSLVARRHTRARRLAAVSRCARSRCSPSPRWSSSSPSFWFYWRTLSMPKTVNVRCSAADGQVEPSRARVRLDERQRLLRCRAQRKSPYGGEYDTVTFLTCRTLLLAVQHVTRRRRIVGRHGSGTRRTDIAHWPRFGHRGESSHCHRRRWATQCSLMPV